MYKAPRAEGWCVAGEPTEVPAITSIEEMHFAVTLRLISGSRFAVITVASLSLGRTPCVHMLGTSTRGSR